MLLLAGAPLSIVPGSPFQVTGALIGSAGVPPYTYLASPQYLVSYDATSLYTYLIGSNGAIGPQVSTSALGNRAAHRSTQ